MGRRLAKAGHKEFAASLKPIKTPEDLAYLLVWYDDLRNGTMAGMGHNPIQYSEIEAYGRLYRLDIDAFDVEMLRMIDGVWFECLPKKDP